MPKNFVLQCCARGLTAALLALPLVSPLNGQTPGCVPPSSQQLSVYHAGSLNAAFKSLEKVFTCQTGIQVKDVAGASVGLARRCTAGGESCDLYASADYSNIDDFLKPAGYADFTILFADGRMVLAYSAKDAAAKKLTIADPASGPFDPAHSVPKASADWYKILTSPGVTIGGAVPFMDPGAYRPFMLFQLAQAYYKDPMLNDKLMEHVVVSGPAHSFGALGNLYDFQFVYEHNARGTALKNPDFRYVDLPEEIGLSDTAKNAYYAQNAVVYLPGLGNARSPQAVPVRGSRVAWGITILKDAPNRKNAVKFLQMLLGPEGTATLDEYGPDPVVPASVTSADFRKLPLELRPLVKSTSAKK